MKSESGFTLVELMVAIAIIAVLCGIALPSYIGRLPARRMESAASDVNAAIQVARLSAIKENTSTILQFDVDDESYSITETVSGRLVKSGKMPAGVDLEDVFKSDGTSAPGGSITFDSRGFPTPPVDVVLRNTTGTTWTIQINMTGSSRLIRG